MDTQRKPRKGDIVEFLAGSTGTKLKGKVGWVASFAPEFAPEFALEGLDESFTTDASHTEVTLAADLVVTQRCFQVGDTNPAPLDITEEVKDEPATEIVSIRRARDFRAGDVVMVASHPEDDAAVITVRREVPPKPAVPEHEFGTATANGIRIRGFRAFTVPVGPRAEASAMFVYPTVGGGYVTAHEGYFEDFEPERTDAPPALPSREALAEAIKGVNRPHAGHDLYLIRPDLAADRALKFLGIEAS